MPLSSDSLARVLRYVLLEAVRRIALRHTRLTSGTIRPSVFPYQAEYHVAYFSLKRAAS